MRKLPNVNRIILNIPDLNYNLRGGFLKIFSERDQFELLKTMLECKVLDISSQKFIYERNFMEFDEIDFC